ncbi:tRNA(Ser) Um(44) 2'-O-methyltransferase [Coemansia interrupta]|uniref:tRNA (uracil-O(2)-)-methyltransferase n=1 Tax=Coemansia interrupta TaxID=1126814 RepID=A0A9W8H931_9FUNG|nr:tRNA(Ser) Um(44) 2'-O-methyltransferase [Coemansia interrupta]
MSTGLDIDSWRILAEADIGDSEECHFLSVIDKWIREAELIIPPIKSTEIIEDTSNSISSEPSGDISFPTTNHTVRHVCRVLVPKRKNKDPTIQEHVDIIRTNAGIFARFTPQLGETMEIPFYYPKVHEFAFAYVESGGNIHHESGCKLAIVARELNPRSTTTTSKQCMIWKDLIKRLYKWTATERFGYQKRVLHDVVVGYDVYTAKYQELKAKYALHWVENWPEQTDPRKFVYEDIAIASWIICLWQKEQDSRKKRPTFVDLGCGNGLLVHLLNSEGFNGFGIDQCSRRVWGHFGDGVDLRAQTLVPYEFTVDTDWIIGNHADELVPWIPAIAARSSSSARYPGFIVIPCCPHDLSGSKMTFPAMAGQSKYHLYVNYIVDLASKCGFEVEKEYLRIPSTKNVAIVGTPSANINARRTFVDSLLHTGAQDFVARIPDSIKNEIRLEKAREKARGQTE